MDQTMNWRKSRRCDSSACLWASIGPTTVYVTDGQGPQVADGRVLVFDRSDWAGLVASVKSGRVHRPGTEG